MSEGEIYELLEKVIDRCNECKFATCENCEINWKQVQAIGNLLDLYNKEKEENKYLKSQIPTDKIFYYSYKDFISKDKIKEKIKEFETLPLLDIAEKEKFNFKYSIDGLFAIKQGVIYILQELLGD